MTGHVGIANLSSTSQRGAQGFAVVVALVVCVSTMHAAHAQDAWSPMVVTAPGGTLNPQVPETARFLKLELKTPGAIGAARASPHQVPQGAWSPIVTGGIPQGYEAELGAQVPPLSAEQQAGVPTPAPVQMVPLSPVRPLVKPKVAAAGETKTPPAAPAAVPQSPASPGAAAPATAAPSSAAADADGTFFKKPSPLDALPPDANAAQQYCFNTVDSASDARFAWQAQKIKDMEAELEKRVQRLQAKTAEYKEWMERRDAFSRKAHEKLVGFYSRMRPDAAAVQLATLDENVAAAVVTKLETKVASQIMGEMDPERAAKIAMIISGAAKIPASGKRPAEPAAAAEPGGSSGTPTGAAQAPPQPEQPRS
jgi:flagellar motility protein MotE (MotC chaperone)